MSNNPQIIYTGSTITIEPDFKVTLVSGATQVNVTTVITYPPGVSYSSHELSAGTFDGTNWVIPVLIKNDPQGLLLTVVIDDIDAFHASDRTITATTTIPGGGESELENNEVDRVIDNIITCNELSNCGDCCNNYSFIEQETGRLWVNGSKEYWRTWHWGVGDGVWRAIPGLLKTYAITKKWKTQDGGGTAYDSANGFNIRPGTTEYEANISATLDTDVYLHISYVKSTVAYTPTYIPALYTPSYTPTYEYAPTYSPTNCVGCRSYLQVCCGLFTDETSCENQSSCFWTGTECDCVGYGPTYTPVYTPIYTPIYLSPTYTPVYTPVYTPTYTPV